MLDESVYYASPETIPAWRVAWHFWDIDETEFEKAAAKVEAQFSRREFTVPGEMFQVFGLQLLFSDIGVISSSRTDVTNECQRYIDDLYDTGRLPDPLISPRDGMGFDGLGFFDADTVEFRSIVKHFDTVSSKALKRSFPTKGCELLNLMASDIQSFFRQLCVNNVSNSPFSDLPVLASIRPDVFVDRVLTLRPAAQRSVFTMFTARYERGTLAGPLKEEKSWILAVRNSFEKNMNSMGLMSKYRLRNQIDRSFEKFLTTEEMQLTLADS